MIGEMFDTEKHEKIVKELIKQLVILNEHLADYKKMIAPWLGYEVKENEEE